jgi:hypothetical protein
MGEAEITKDVAAAVDQFEIVVGQFRSLLKKYGDVGQGCRS